MYKNFIAFLLVLLPCSVYSYRFICNGMLANGEERADECGVCNDEHAARWESPSLEVVVDHNKLPKGISKSLWQQIVANSFQAWEQVSGSNLRFTERAAPSRHEFGANEDVHEIFWITDRQEWRRLIGSGEFGTLGATLPRYLCNEEEKSRTIIDADLALNGLSHINWQMDCHSEDCISPQTTLVHELGHFFGLDHPCLMCSSSIMSARAGFDLTHPVFDDMQGLRALYPDNSSGGFGYPCGSDHDCHDNGVCLNTGEQRYCSKKCTSNNDCELGTICQGYDGKNFCAFVDDFAAGGKGEGESCLNKPCSEPMVCAGASDYNYFCFMPCAGSGDCGANQTCVRLDDGLSLCVVVKELAESCGHKELCDDGLFCVFDTLSAGFCRAPCLKTTKAESGCPSAHSCQHMADGVELCIPDGHGLMLDEGRDGFGQEQGPGKGNGARTKASGGTSFGCRQWPLADNSPIVWWFLFIALTLKKIPSSLFFRRR